MKNRCKGRHIYTSVNPYTEKIVKKLMQTFAEARRKGSKGAEVQRCRAFNQNHTHSTKLTK